VYVSQLLTGKTPKWGEKRDKSAKYANFG